eukprot:m51a1_g14165 hypothetical protein (298) ;mRNA; r:5147-6493
MSSEESKRAIAGGSPPPKRRRTSTGAEFHVSGGAINVGGVVINIDSGPADLPAIASGAPAAAQVDSAAPVFGGTININGRVVVNLGQHQLQSLLHAPPAVPPAAAALAPVAAAAPPAGAVPSAQVAPAPPESGVGDSDDTFCAAAAAATATPVRPPHYACHCGVWTDATGSAVPLDILVQPLSASRPVLVVDPSITARFIDLVENPFRGHVLVVLPLPRTRSIVSLDYVVTAGSSEAGWTMFMMRMLVFDQPPSLDDLERLPGGRHLRSQLLGVAVGGRIRSDVVADLLAAVGHPPI